MENRISQQTSFAYRCLHHPVYGKAFRYQCYKTAEIIQPTGTPIEEFGIVVDGILKANLYTVNGCELCSAYFEDCDVFPEFLYFTGKKVYTYTLAAVKKTEVAWIATSVFERMLQDDSEMMYSFMLYISKRGLKNQMLLNCLNYQTIQERVAYWLIGMNNLSQNEHIPLPKSQTMWANTLRVSRSSLNQEIKRMEALGYFRIDGHNLVLLNQKALEDLL